MRAQQDIDGRVIFPLPEYMAQRHQLHASLVEAIAERDKAQALHLIAEHNTTGQLRPAPVPGLSGTGLTGAGLTGRG